MFSRFKFWYLKQAKILSLLLIFARLSVDVLMKIVQKIVLIQLYFRYNDWDNYLQDLTCRCAEKAHASNIYISRYNDWDNYLQDLTCRCAEKAHASNFTHFALKDLGICVSGPNVAKTFAVVSDAIISFFSFILYSHTTFMEGRELSPNWRCRFRSLRLWSV